jgi:hypothetical protein
MAEIGSLIIRLEAQTAALRADMAQARQIIDQNSSMMQKSLAGVRTAANVAATAIASIGVSIGVGAIVAFGRQVAETAGGLGELADELGVTTDGLQALQYQALQSGASAETLQAGLGRLTRSIGDAAEGNDQLLNRFKQLGIGILNANGQVRSTEEIFSELAVALNDIEDPAKRAAIVVDIFGKAGQKLIPTLQDVGRVGLQGVIDQAKLAGAIIEAQTIKKFDDLSDAAARNAKIMTVWAAEGISSAIDEAKKFGAAVMVAVDALALLNPLERMRKGMPAFGPVTPVQPSAPGGVSPPMAGTSPRELGLGGNYSLGMAAARVQDRSAVANIGSYNPASNKELKDEIAARQFMDTLRLQAETYGLVESAAIKLRMEREKEREIVNGQIIETPKWTKAQIDAAYATARQTEEVTRLRESLNKYFEEAGQMDAQIAREAGFWGDLRDKRNGAVREMERSNELQKKEAELIGRSQIVWNQYTKQYELVNRELLIFNEQQRILQMNLGLSDEAARAQAAANVDASERVRQATEQQSAALKKQQAFLDEIGAIGENAFDRIGSAVTTAMVTGQNEFITFGSVAIGVISEVTQAIAKMFIINPIKDAATDFLGGAIKGGIGNLFGGSGISNYFGGASYASLGNANLPFGGPRAGGGGVNPGTAYEVGERGREIFVPNAAGRVFPIDGEGGMSGGVSIEVYDQRTGSAVNQQPIKPQASRGPDFRTVVKMYVKDVLPEILNSGSQDKTMSKNFGVGRTPVMRG